MSSENMSTITKSHIAVVIVTFVAWTLTSFLCHECGKIFLSGYETLRQCSGDDAWSASNFLASWILTTAQCITCILCVSMTSDFCSTLTIVMVMSHVMATWVTNYSLSYIEAASTLAIKLTEPVTMAIAHHVVFKTPVSIEIIVSFPLIIFGALMFSVRTTLISADSLGVSLAFLSNVIFAARNVAIKKLQMTNLPVQLRSLYQVCGLLFVQAIVLIVMYFLENGQVVPAKTFFIVAAMFISGIAHVTYSYISTNIVLTVMNIVSHSIANIAKRLLVVFLLYSFGKRSASDWNLFGVLITCIGLYVYVMKKSSATSNDKPSFWTSKLVYRGVLISLSLVSALYLCIILTNIDEHPNHCKKTESISTQYSVYRLTDVESGMDTITLFNSSREPNDKDQHLERTSKLKCVTKEEFLTWHLVDHPEETDIRAKTLTKNVEIIDEAQRILINILSDLIGPIQHVMLMEIATYSNKGDPAISAGEIVLLRKMNKTVVYYCETYTCSKGKHLKQEREISKHYTEDNLAILMQGGGNLVGYSNIDKVRKEIIQRYPRHKKILFSQSIWLNDKNCDSLKNAQKIYSNVTNLTIFLRDRQSLAIAKKYFHGIRLILAPDLAFGLGALPRQMPPIYDIIWLQRKDTESSKYTLPEFPTNISVHISDWLSQWTSNVGTRDMETSFLIAFSGINFLQRGRVVVTDRLHGHILSTLLNIPHVLIDNPPYFKLSSFHNSWTYSLENTFIIDNGTFALEKAMELLNKYKTVLPQVGLVDMNRFPRV